MSAEEVADTVRATDRKILKGSEVDDAAKCLNITSLYHRYSWGGAGPTPLPPDALERLRMEDRTADPRWMEHFDGHRVDVGVYRSVIGYYWLLRFDAAVNQHFLEHVGTAADVAARYGDGS